MMKALGIESSLLMLLIHKVYELIDQKFIVNQFNEKLAVATRHFSRRILEISDEFLVENNIQVTQTLLRSSSSISVPINNNSEPTISQMNLLQVPRKTSNAAEAIEDKKIKKDRKLRLKKKSKRRKKSEPVPPEFGSSSEREQAKSRAGSLPEAVSHGEEEKKEQVEDEMEVKKHSQKAISIHQQGREDKQTDLILNTKRVSGLIGLLGGAEDAENDFKRFVNLDKSLGGVMEKVKKEIEQIAIDTENVWKSKMPTSKFKLRNNRTKNKAMISAHLDTFSRDLMNRIKFSLDKHFDEYNLEFLLKDFIEVRSKILSNLSVISFNANNQFFSSSSPPVFASQWVMANQYSNSSFSLNQKAPLAIPQLVTMNSVDLTYREQLQSRSQCIIQFAFDHLHFILSKITDPINKLKGKIERELISKKYSDFIFENNSYKRPELPSSMLHAKNLTLTTEFNQLQQLYSLSLSSYLRNTIRARNIYRKSSLQNSVSTPRSRDGNPLPRSLSESVTSYLDLIISIYLGKVDIESVDKNNYTRLEPNIHYSRIINYIADQYNISFKLLSKNAYSECKPTKFIVRDHLSLSIYINMHKSWVQLSLDGRSMKPPPNDFINPVDIFYESEFYQEI